MEEPSVKKGSLQPGNLSVVGHGAPTVAVDSYRFSVRLTSTSETAALSISTDVPFENHLGACVDEDGTPSQMPDSSLSSRNKYCCNNDDSESTASWLRDQHGI
jgi:hypothetical protein